MTKQEIEKRKKELQEKILKAETQEELAELRKEVLEINKEVAEDEEKRNDGYISPEEERSLIRDTQNLERQSVEIVNLRKYKEGETMKEKLTRNNVFKSEEYRSAWAKKLMCREDYTEEEQRALDVALTTTDKTFTAPTADADGVNNGGLFIPETVSLEILKEIELESPFLRDVARTFIKGLISYPYKKSDGEVEHPKEGKENKLASQEYASLTFGQAEISTTIRITWKLEAMAVEDFISFVISEISKDIREELASNGLYGTGTEELKGATKDSIDAEYEANTEALDAIHAALKKLPKRKKSGAKIYMSESMALDIAFAKDENGRFINNPVNGIGLDNIAKYKVEVDPMLEDGDFVIGNAKWYKLNFNEGISVTKDVIGRARVNDYTGYAVVGGAPVPNSFVYGHKKTTTTEDKTQQGV